MGELLTTMIINSSERFTSKLAYKELDIDFDKIEFINLNSGIANCLDKLNIRKNPGVLIRTDMINEVMNMVVSDKEYVVFYEYAYESMKVTKNIKHIVSFASHIDDIDSKTFIYRDLLFKYNKPYTYDKSYARGKPTIPGSPKNEEEVKLDIALAKENANLYPNEIKPIGDNNMQKMLINASLIHAPSMYEKEVSIFGSMMFDPTIKNIDGLKVVPKDSTLTEKDIAECASEIEKHRPVDYLGMLDAALTKRKALKQKKPCEVLLQPKPLNTKLIDDAISSDLLEEILEIYPFDKHQDVYLTYFSIKKYSLENKMILGRKIFKEEG